MAVGSHLGIAVGEYDARIRTFVPFYEEMLDAAAEATRGLAAPSPFIVELGTGSGALAARIISRRRGARVLGIDEDPAMLAMAAARVRGRRVEWREGNFSKMELPPADAVVASLALHHVKSRVRKAELYARVARGLEPGGLLINADCTPPVDTTLAGRAMDAWRAHLETTYSRREAAAYLRAWALEDRYQPIDVELELMARAGLTPDVVWRRETFAVIVGRKRRGRSRRA